jgi:hypothetical protein
MSEKRRAESIAAARSEIAKRIGKFCTTLAPEELDLLLDRMARVQLKYQMMPIDSAPADIPPRPPKFLA